MAEDTIEAMERGSSCRHPVHQHAFQTTRVLFAVQCVACDETMRGADSVRCILCGQYAHRRCAFSGAWSQERHCQAADQHKLNPLAMLSSVSARLRQSLVAAAFMPLSSNRQPHIDDDSDNSDKQNWTWSATGPPPHWGGP
mmetsp:Transcript_1658/g.4561  ORF Transcript_1658/g.4561 Transcript_1658/m.4561 type:complete len:141 (-) Transcript_1658:670-1092(-)